MRLRPNSEKMFLVNILNVVGWCNARCGSNPAETQRYRRKPALITAQLPIAQWHETIGEATTADILLDCIVHNAHRIALEGDSMRKQKPRPLLTEARNAEINKPSHQPGERKLISRDCPRSSETTVPLIRNPQSCHQIPHFGRCPVNVTVFSLLLLSMTLLWAETALA